jgi:hypothetical protein
VPEPSGRSTAILFFENVDADLVEAERIQGCRHCPGKLHRADYRRKPRGLKFWPNDPKQTKRFSLCCDREGCRRRHTPPSVRFLGRRVYGGVVAVLFPAMVHGLKPERVRQIRERLDLQIDRRTLERWRQWWLGLFVRSAFWKEARARFMPPLCQNTLPLSLCLSFQVEERRDRLLELFKFLSPITTPEAWRELVV